MYCNTLKSSVLRQTCKFLKYKHSGLTLWFPLHIPVTYVVHEKLIATKIILPIQ